ncbi:MAG: universal stress protein [Rhizobacter sp.]|nr:universal stress protein [Burkholderiaceae bacterium]MCO5124796.1 universal stress protein [Rhizobacter sp.]
MFEHLLVPIDGSDLSQRAMDASIELARKLGARITGFIAEPFATPPPGIGMAYLDAVKKHDKSAFAHAEGVLSAFAARCAEAGVAFTPHATQAGQIDDAILAAAAKHGCDMIVMVTHGRSALGELMWGSHAKTLLSRSRLPLLVLH